MRWRFKLHQADHRLVFLFFLLWVFALVLSALFYLYGPPVIPLWYSLNILEQRLAPSYYIWVFPAMSTVILLISLFNGRRTNLEHERYLARLSLLTGLALQFLILIAQLRIIKIIL